MKERNTIYFPLLKEILPKCFLQVNHITFPIPDMASVWVGQVGLVRLVRLAGHNRALDFPGSVVGRAVPSKPPIPAWRDLLGEAAPRRFICRPPAANFGRARSPSAPPSPETPQTTDGNFSPPRANRPRLRHGLWGAAVPAAHDVAAPFHSFPQVVVQSMP